MTRKLTTARNSSIKSTIIFPLLQNEKRKTKILNKNIICYAVDGI